VYQGVSFVFPCPWCGHPDGRDATHARGCPRLPPVTQARMLEIALACERGWRDAEIARIDARIARKQREAERQGPPAKQSGRGGRAREEKE